jgi:2-iminobutanoate/2-iminopropanoate deaminase
MPWKNSRGSKSRQFVVKTLTPEAGPRPIGPYSHAAVANGFVFVSATAGINPRTNQLAGRSLGEQLHQIFDNLEGFLAAAGSNLRQVVHVTIYLKDVKEFEAMNTIYSKRVGAHRPARTVIGVTDLPKRGARLTMSAIALRGQKKIKHG